MESAQSHRIALFFQLALDVSLKVPQITASK